MVVLPAPGGAWSTADERWRSAHRTSSIVASTGRPERGTPGGPGGGPDVGIDQVSQDRPDAGTTSGRLIVRAARGAAVPRHEEPVLPSDRCVGTSSTLVRSGFPVVVTKIWTLGAADVAQPVDVGRTGCATNRLRPHSHSATPTRAPRNPPTNTHSHGALLGNPACVMPRRFSYDFTTSGLDPWCGTGHIIAAPMRAPKKPPHPCWNKNSAQPGSGFMVYLPVQLLPPAMLRRSTTPE